LGAAAKAAAPILFVACFVGYIARVALTRENRPRGIVVKLPVRLGICLALISGLFPCSGQSPEAAADHRKNAIMLQESGHFSEAADEWRIYLKAHPQSIEANADLGLVEARQEHYKEAIPYYRKALLLNPRMSGIRLNLGLAYFKTAAMKEAIETFTPLLKSLPANSPDRLRVETLIGLAHYSIGNFTAAIPYLKTAANNEPQNILYRFSLAQGCLNVKQYQCVLDEYQELLKINGESAAADMLAGQAYDEMKNSAGAIEQFRAAVKADPKWPNAHFGLGYLLWTQNQCEEASKEFQAELENVPEHAEAMTFLADCKVQLGQSNDALPLIEKALKIDPSIARAHMNLGIIYQDQGRQQDALRELKAAVKLTPGDSNIHWRLARLYQSMGRKEEAKVEFEKTSSLKKAESDSIFTELKAAQQRGGTTDAAADAASSK
jgi:tetratricopeptide (TPR) repeat protein